MSFGGGGPINVVRALAVSGRTVRVVFAEAPVFRSPGGPYDAMNPSLFFFSVDAGTATSPLATAVGSALVAGPARGVGNGGAAEERGVDVGVDRGLIAGITYRVAVRDVQSAFGGILGSSYSQPFSGVVPLQEKPKTIRGRPTTNIDYGNDPFLGSWRADDSGDIAPQDAASGFRKRVLRRLMTFKDSFAFLKGYGVTVKLKELEGLAEIAALKVDVERQILLEPETAAVSVDVSLLATNVLIVSVRVKTKVGAFIEAGLRIDLAGGGVSPF